MSKITDKIEKRFYKIDREIFLKKVVGNLGTIVESEDKIIIYATQKLIEKNGKNILYKLNCNGMNTYYEEFRKVVDKYDLNKPVYYIFDNIVFDTFTQLSAYFCNVIFKNCTFNNGLQVIYGENVTLENNKYNNWTDFYGYGNSFLYGHVGELTIKNDTFMNSYKAKMYSKTRFGINIKAEKVNIEKSNIFAESLGEIDINAKEISIINSTINGSEIYLNSNHIISNNSLLNAKSGIIIENENCDFTGNVQSPTVIYNGVDFNATNKVISMNPYDIELQRKRKEFLEQLYNIKEYCKQANASVIYAKQEQLNSEPISRVLNKNK